MRYEIRPILAKGEVTMNAITTDAVASVYVGSASGCRCGCRGWWSEDPESIAAVVDVLQRAPVVCVGPFSVEYVFDDTVYVAEFRDRNPEKVSEYIALIRESAEAEAAEAAKTETSASGPLLGEIQREFGSVDAFLEGFNDEN
jgi:hypothetical protein